MYVGNFKVRRKSFFIFGNSSIFVAPQRLKRLTYQVLYWAAKKNVRLLAQSQISEFNRNISFRIHQPLDSLNRKTGYIFEYVDIQLDYNCSQIYVNLEIIV